MCIARVPEIEGGPSILGSGATRARSSPIFYLQQYIKITRTSFFASRTLFVGNAFILYEVYGTCWELLHEEQVLFLAELILFLTELLLFPAELLLLLHEGVTVKDAQKRRSSRKSSLNRLDLLRDFLDILCDRFDLSLDVVFTLQPRRCAPRGSRDWSRTSPSAAPISPKIE